MTPDPIPPGGHALDALLRGLTAAECAYSATDIADALWLFTRVARETVESVDANDAGATLEPSAALTGPAPHELPPVEPFPLPPSLPPSVRMKRTGKRRARPQPAAVSVPGGDSDPSGMRVHVPSDSPLSDRRAVIGALRPLMTRRRSRTRLELDIEATIQRGGEEGSFALVFSPGLDRWLDVSIVIDSSVSMEVWGPTLRDLRHVFETLGAFRQMRTWHLGTDEAVPTLHAARRRKSHVDTNATPPRRPLDVVGTPGASLVLVVTDCVSEAWYQPTLAKWLHDWSRVANVAILNVLPPRMWSRTAAGDFRTGTLRREGGGFGAPLTWQPEWPTAAPRGERVRPIPMTVLELSELGSFVKFVAGRGVDRARGVVIPPPPPPSPPPADAPAPEQPPAESPGVRAVHAFRGRASSQAQWLAKLLAAAPVINLEVMRLLAEAVPPPDADEDADDGGYRPEHLAEVWLGGLLQSDEAGTAPDPAKVRYNLPTDAREMLLDGLPRPEAIRVLENVTRYAKDHCDWGSGLWAFLQNRDATGPRLKRDGPIAELAADVLKRLGGEYSRFAQDEADPYADADPDFEMPDDVLTPVEETLEEAALAKIEELHGVVRKWIEDTAAAQKNTHLRQNLPYVDLYFAFVFGIYQDRTRGERLVEDARKVMERPVPTVGTPQAEQAVTAAVTSNTLFKAYQYRIETVLAGKPHTGPLSPAVTTVLEDLTRKSQGGPINNPYKLAEYIVTGMRNRSRIAEPEERPDPYADWTKHGDPMKKQLADLRTIREPAKLADRIRKLHREGVDGKARWEVQFYVLHEALPMAPRVGEAFTAEMIQLVPASLANGTGAATESPDLPRKQGELLERALFLAGHYDRVDLAKLLVDSFIALLRGKPEETRFKLINVVSGQCLRSLVKLGMRDEVDRFLTNVYTEAFRGAASAEVKKRYASRPESWSAALQTLLHLAGGWLSVGLTDRAEPILVEARQELLSGSGISFQPKDYTELAEAYVAALGHGPAESGLQRLSELFRKMNPSAITNTWTTAQYYSRFHLKLVEETIFALCSIFR